MPCAETLACEKASDMFCFVLFGLVGALLLLAIITIRYTQHTIARAEYYGEVEGFETTSYLYSEQEFTPWYNADNYLAYPSLMLARFQDTFTYHVVGSST